MKVKLKARNCLYPMPVMLVGALVDGQPNYLPVVFVGILEFNTVAVSLDKAHFTNAGIQANQTFSLNVPAASLVRETDACGIVSGRQSEKLKLFDTFYGQLESAPLIVGCPINMECRLVHTLELPKHNTYIGEIVATHADETLLTGGLLDYAKLDPILFVMEDKGYWRLGERFAQAWEVGKELKAQL